MGDLKIAVHQPNYLPWLGFFHKVQAVDTFVLLDTVQFERRGFTHRVRIIEPGGALLWLTESIRKRPINDYRISDVLFSDLYWVGKHLKMLSTVYGRAPHFDEVFGVIEECLKPDIEMMSSFNGRLIKTICDSLNIQTKIVYASEIDIPAASSPSERIALITRKLGGTCYVSGAGAKAYNDTATFERHGVKLTYDTFSMQRYPQRNSEFNGGLSIVDALFMVGFAGVASILHAPESVGEFVPGGITEVSAN